MGTNYYVRAGNCDGCGRYEEIHLGKTAAGWRFLHRAYRDPDRLPDGLDFPVTDRASWLKLAALGPIHDQYDKPITRDDLLALIERAQDRRSGSDPEAREWERHSTMPRSVLDSLRASDYTDGAYDFCDREFS